MFRRDLRARDFVERFVVGVLDLARNSAFVMTSKSAADIMIVCSRPFFVIAIGVRCARS